MNKENYYIKVGDLYLNGLYTSPDEPNTYFIRSIDLNCNKELANKYTYEDALQIRDILELIHINAEICESFIID